jgi:ATP-binding cassette subfamily B multidrug efflux pump
MRDFGYSEKGQSVAVADLALWRRILRYSANYRYPIGVAVILSLGVTGATLGLPYLLKTAIDGSITADQLAMEQRLAGLTTIGLWFAVLIAVNFLLMFTQVVLLEWVGQSVMHRIRQELFAHILNLDLSFLTRQPVGRLVTRLTNDVQNMHEMFTSVLVTLFNDILRIFGILIVLLVLNAKLGGIMSLYVPLAFVMTWVFSQMAREKFRAIRAQLSRINTYIQESVSGIAIIQLFNAQSRFARDFLSLSDEYLRRTLSQIRLFAAFMPLSELLSTTAIAIILWFGGSLILKNQLTIGELVAFLAYMRLFFQPLRELSQKYSIVQSALASAERIFAMLDVKPLIVDPPRPQHLKDIAGRIEFAEVRFSYDGVTPILDCVSLTVEPGETVAIVGATGSGKTTLINLLLRFYEPQKGRISIDGVTIDQLPLAELRGHVGVILQDVFILKDTLLANIVLDSGRSRDEVRTILRHTGIDRFVRRLPDGLDTIIGEAGRELSTGEKQLLSFARALCRNPPILVLDEATASIDSESESILEEAIATSFADRTSIVIAHRLSTIRRADHIIVMEQGVIVEAGPHEQLMVNRGRYAELIELDLHNDRRKAVATT